MLNQVERASAVYFIHRPKKTDKTNMNEVFIMIQIMKEKKNEIETRLSHKYVRFKRALTYQLTSGSPALL